MSRIIACEIFVWSTKTGAYHIDIVNNKNMYWRKQNENEHYPGSRFFYRERTS